METIRRRSGETDYEYGLRLIESKMESHALDIDWQDIVDILELDIHRDTLRKSVQSEFGGYNVYKHMSKKIEDILSEKAEDNSGTKELLDKLRKTKKDVKIERYKLQTENVELNRWHREVSRIELWEERMHRFAKCMEPFDVPEEIVVSDEPGDKVGVLGIADTHFGKLVDIKGLNEETLNYYDEDEFEKRMWHILSEVGSIIEREKLTKIDLYLLGDLIDGMLRQSQLRSLQYGITDSVMKFSEFMATWLNELSRLCRVEVFTSMGNHSEIRPLNSRSGDFPHENVERLIAWYVQSRLDENSNIKIHDANFINYKDTLGVGIFATHGHKDRNLENSIRDYQSLYKVDVDLLLTGHKHHSKTRSVGIANIGNVELIQFPSICGIDDFSMRIKKSALPGTNMLIIEEGKGKTITYDINIQ